MAAFRWGWNSKFYFYVKLTWNIKTRLRRKVAHPFVEKSAQTHSPNKAKIESYIRTLCFHLKFVNWDNFLHKHISERETQEERNIARSSFGNWKSKGQRKKEKKNVNEKTNVTLTSRVRDLIRLEEEEERQERGKTRERERVGKKHLIFMVRLIGRWSLRS